MYYIASVKCPYCETKQNTLVGSGSFFPTNILNCSSCFHIFDQTNELYEIPYVSLYNKSNNHLAT